MGRWLRAPRLETLLVTGFSLIVLFGCGGGGGGGGGGGIVAPPLDSIPANWAGIWSVNVVAKACGTTKVLLNETVVDTLCAGQSTSSLSLDTLCTNASFRATGNTTTYSCTDNVSIADNCSGIMTVNVTTTINPVAGTSLGSGRLTFNVEPETTECFDVCVDVTMTGTRTGAAPAECNASPTLLAKALRGRSLASLFHR